MRNKVRNRNRSKHQHWVPQFYLRYFATPESRGTKTPQVWIFSKNPEDGDEQLTSVRNVCGKRYLYSPRQLDGNRDWALDDKLNDVEALLGHVWSKLATDYVDLADEHIRKALSLFVSITHMRHPDARDEMEHIHAKMVEFFENGPTQADGTPMIDSIEVGGKSYQLETSNWHNFRNQGEDGHDRAFANMVQSEAGRMAERLLTKRWSILLSEQDVFVTSDKPVGLTHLKKERYGYGTEDTIITFPISPSRLLVMDDQHSEPANQYYPLIKSNAGAVNMTIWRNSRRFLITGRPVSEVMHEINAFTEGGSDA